MKWSGTHEHTFTNVVRRNGRSVRYGCDTCPKIGPWVRFVDEADVPTSKYEGMNVLQLKQEAREAGIHGYSKMKRAELVDALTFSPSNANQ